MRSETPSADRLFEIAQAQHGLFTTKQAKQAGYSEVVASNITAFETENGIRLKNRRGRGGVVEDVRFNNWTMDHVGEGIVVTSYYVMGG